MTTTEIRQGFNQMIAAAAAQGNSEAAAKMELAREFFANKEFRTALEDHVFQINQRG